MQPSRLGLGLTLSLLMHLALLLAPAALFSRLAAPWELAPANAEIEARLRPLARPQLMPTHPPRKKSPRRSQLPAPQAPLAPLPPAPETATAPSPATPSLPQASTVAAPPPALAVAEPPPPPGVDLPRQGRIQFNVSRGDQGLVVGRAVHRWRLDGGRYELSNVTETTGLAAIFRPVRMVQSSVGALSGSTLQPREYRSERDGKLVDAASFDWSAKRLSYGGRSVPLLAGAQDMLSAFYQLGRQAAEAGMELPLTTGRKFEIYSFLLLGEEKLTLPFGEVRTIHLKSGGEPGRDATEVWLAPSMRGLPLKIRYTDREGEAFNQIAAEIEFDDNTATAAEKR